MQHTNCYRKVGAKSGCCPLRRKGHPAEIARTVPAPSTASTKASVDINDCQTMAGCITATSVCFTFRVECRRIHVDTGACYVLTCTSPRPLSPHPFSSILSSSLLIPSLVSPLLPRLLFLVLLIPSLLSTLSPRPFYSIIPSSLLIHSLVSPLLPRLLFLGLLITSLLSIRLFIFFLVPFLLSLQVCAINRE